MLESVLLFLTSSYNMRKVTRFLRSATSPNALSSLRIAKASQGLNVLVCAVARRDGA